MANVTTRRATSADADLLAELGARTFSDTFAQDNTPEDMAEYLTASFSPQILAARLADSANSFLIAEIENVPAGYAQLALTTPPLEIGGHKPIEIERIYSDKAWLGRGVGAALMSACLQRAADLGCDTIWLGVWQQNPRAIAFYKKWGFAVVGTQTFQLGRDLQSDYLMQRRVASDSATHFNKGI
jgi:ribosomal protein S18 acetylase RimI-like enzyme